MAYFSKCGTQIQDENSTYCPYCGNEIHKGNSAQQNDAHDAKEIARYLKVSNITTIIFLILLPFFLICITNFVGGFYTMMADEYAELEMDTYSIICLIGIIVSFVGFIPTAIVLFVAKGRLAKVNGYFAQAFRHSLKSYGASTASSMIDNVSNLSKSSVVRGIGGAASTGLDIYAAIQQFKAMKNLFLGYEYYAKKFQDEEGIKISKKLGKSYFIVTYGGGLILSLVLIGLFVLEMLNAYYGGGNYQTAVSILRICLPIIFSIVECSSIYVVALEVRLRKIFQFHAYNNA